MIRNLPGEGSRMYLAAMCHPTIRRRAAAGAAAGMAAALAYAIEQELDLRGFRHNADDLTLIGRLVTSNQHTVRPVGLAIHLLNGASLGIVYATVARGHLPGSPAMRGIWFSLLENTLLYPLALLEDRHPGVRDGTLDRYWNVTAFAQESIRHVVYGTVLGTVTHRLLPRES